MTAPTLDDYLPLITSEHRDKPKFVAMMTLYAQWAVDVRTMLLSLPALFDIDTAVGQQLDYIGQWVGAFRTITIQPNAVYPIPSAPYQVDLTDIVFRRYIKAKILANGWDGDPSQIQAIYETFWAGTGTSTAVLDYQDMSIEVYVVGAAPTPAELAIVVQFLLPVRPVGVRLRGIWVSLGGPLFGLDIENTFIAGPSVGYFGTFIPGT